MPIDVVLVYYYMLLRMPLFPPSLETHNLEDNRYTWDQIRI